MPEENAQSKASLLKSIPVLSDLSQQAREELSGLLCSKTCRPQEVIFKKGDIGEEMFVIIEGEVRVHDGNHVLTRLGAGEVFGEYALIDHESRSASVTAEKDCLLLCLKKSDLKTFMTHHPEILFGMLQSQIKRMRDMNELEDKLSKSYLKISKQKNEIEAQHASIREQKKELEEQNKVLNSLHENKKQLMRTLIHGMKNPLTSAMMMVDMLAQSRNIEKDNQEYIQLLKTSMQRMDEVFNQIIRSNEKEESELT